MIENDTVLAIKNLRRKRQKVHVCIYLYSVPVILVIEICVDKTVELVKMVDWYLYIFALCLRL